MFLLTCSFVISIQSEVYMYRLKIYKISLLHRIRLFTIITIPVLDSLMYIYISCIYIYIYYRQNSFCIIIVTILFFLAIKLFQKHLKKILTSPKQSSSNIIKNLSKFRTQFKRLYSSQVNFWTPVIYRRTF